MERKYMMHNPNSQEQTIYRILAGQIQLGFFDDGEHFPSARDIAKRYQVSYCPAQRALKMLENDGFIKLNRGKATSILSKPYENYLESDTFKKRTAALLDLSRSLKLILPVICYQSLYHIEKLYPDISETFIYGGVFVDRHLYQQFEKCLHALINQTAFSLYYDVLIFAESSFTDVLYTHCGKSETVLFLQDINEKYVQCIFEFQKGNRSLVKQKVEQLIEKLFNKIENCLEVFAANLENAGQESFCWEPRKGRTRYCDIIAIDMICKINQGDYPIGELLPGTSALADVYHVSEITMRRTIGLLNKLGVAKTMNGVGTRAIAHGEPETLYNVKGLMLEYKLKTFLEAMQLLIITSEPVFQCVFPYIPARLLDSIGEAISISDEKRSLVATLSAGLQAVVHHCPLAAIREIYSKITLLLLNGSILRIEESGEEPVLHWSSISHDIRESIHARNSKQFGHAFRELTENNYDVINMTIT